MLSVSTGSFQVVMDYAEPLAGQEVSVEQDYFTAEEWLSDVSSPVAAASSGTVLSDHADALTVILDFIDPGQADGDDGGNQVTTFDVSQFGFSLDDYDLVTEAVLEEVRGHYYDIATDDVFPQSAIPAGQELHIEFELGDQGVPPSNGSTDYFYVQIGTLVSGSCAGALGCAGLSTIRTDTGGHGNAGEVVGSIFSDAIQGIGGLNPADALSSGNLEFTAKALGGTTSHEIGHALSLLHLAKEGSVTPNDASPIMGTGAIDTPNQDRIEAREFAYSGVNPQAGGAEQFHITQLVAAIGLTEAGSGPRGPGRIVDSLIDENDGDITEGNFSLREAIELSTINGRRRSIQFSETLAGGTIVLDPSLGSIVIPGPVSIEGLPGNDRITIQAAAPDITAPAGDGQIFVIEYGEAAEFSEQSVEIRDLILTGANSISDGGAISSEHPLVLVNLDVTNNSSTGFGGAIYATGPLDISASTFSDNQANGDGGAIHVAGGAQIDSSTLYNNHSGDEGGAISVEGVGTELIMVSSTLSGNTADGNGGAIHMLDQNPKKFRVLHSTIFQNQADADNNGFGTGGGIYMYDGVLALEHSIVAGNTDNGVAPDLDNLNLFAHPAILARYSLVQNVSGSQITQQDPNLLGSGLPEDSPMLQALADNGGPTWSHLPLAGSPVLNGGDPDIPFPPEFDQRGFGFTRIAESVIDIGAIESSGFSQTFTVNTLVDKNDLDVNGVDASPDDTSLREAVALANRQLGPNLINFESALSGGTINLVLGLGEILITDDLTIDAGDFAKNLSINGATLDPTPSQNNGDGSRLFRVDDSSSSNYIDANFIGLELVGGDVDGDGGAIHSVENLTLQYVSIRDSYATGDGGGIYHKPVEPSTLAEVGSKLLIENSTVANNMAEGSGGGLYSDNQKVSFVPNPILAPLVGQIINSTISNNVAGVEGGGIYNYDGHLELLHVTVTENQAAQGSGVVSFGDAFTKTAIYSSIIAGNVVNQGQETGFDVQKSFGTGGNSFESLGYNLIGLGNAAMAFSNNDITEVVDPKLQPLGNNGGKTLTHALQSESPALDAGDPHLPSVSYGATIEALSPFLYWNLNEESGTNVVDSVGSGDGTVGPGVSLNQTGAASETGNSAKFDDDEQSEGRIQSDQTNLLPTSSLGDNYSISLWFKTDSENAQILFNLSSPPEQGVEGFESLIIWDGSRIIFKGGGATGFLQSDLGLEAGEWHHVSVVNADSMLHLYLDGEINDTTLADNVQLNVDTYLTLGEGSPFGEGGSDYAGYLDEVLIFSKSLTDQEVGILYSSASTPEEELVTEDQRGSGFARIADGDGESLAILDIGAFEVATPEPSADFDDDGDVDGTDFLAWQRGFGKAAPERTDGDSDADGDVDADDLLIWSSQYATTDPIEDSSTIDSLSLGPAFAATAVNDPVGSVPFSGKSESKSLVDLAELAAARANQLSDFGGLSDSLVENTESPEFFFDVAYTSDPVSASSEIGQVSGAGFAKDGTQVTSRPERAFFESLDMAFEGLGLDENF